jgi:F0F1-type ATP synthase assembly protein I
VHHHWKSAGSHSTVGLELALSILFGLYVGQWLDERFSGGGWYSAIGFGFGLAAGGRAVYRALKKANREAERQAEEAKEAERKYFDEN